MVCEAQSENIEYTQIEHGPIGIFEGMEGITQIGSVCHYEFLSHIDNGDENSCDNHEKNSFDTLDASFYWSLVVI